MNQILDQLNPIQREAVLHQNGPLLILAGAGSGKTKTLTHRIAYLVSQGVSPYHILAVTFTNKAAQEMKSRVSKLMRGIQNREKRIEKKFPILPTLPIGQAGNRQVLNSQFSIPFLGTFHSVCVKILHHEIHHLGYSRNFNIYDSEDQLSAIKQSMRKLNYNTNEINPRIIHSIISSAKNDLLDFNDLKNRSNEFIEEVAGETYAVYQAFLKENNALDFDDLIMMTIKIFQKFPKILAKYQNQFKYILVDEYQDTNKAQYLLINLLSKRYQNITVVGDDWQSIYSWRGADISNILNFEKDFKKAKTLKLEQNYRSTQNILDVAHCIISKNKNKKNKKLWTDNEKGDKPVLFEAEDEREEANYIINEIKDSQQQYNRFVVLYRTNAQSRSLEENFLKHNIPYKIIGGLKFYERKEIKDILAYLRVINSFKDTVGLSRIINTPPRRIGAKTLGALEKYAKQNKIDYIKASIASENISGVSAQTKNNLNQFGLIMEYLNKKSKTINLTSLIDLLLAKINYKEFILDGTEEGEYRWENVQELKTVASKFDKNTEGLSKFLEEVALVSDTDEVNDKNNAVTLMTMHATKGLEFSNVFIVGLEENLFPHSRALASQEELEEERRLCYVAMTRAKEKLYLTFARTREIYGQMQSNPQSRFIEDIPKKNLNSHSKSFNAKTIYQDNKKDCEFKSGDKVRHSQFGKGLVIGFSEDLITVIFEKIGIKKLALEYAKLKKF